MSPLQGFRFAENTPTQGVALGWSNDAPLGLKPQASNFKRSRLETRVQWKILNDTLAVNCLFEVFCHAG